MLKQIKLTNFKSFSDTQELEIKPITILIGPNSSGKSSLLQPFLMLKQTVDSRDVTSPLVVNGSYVKLSTYESFIYKHDLTKLLGVDFTFFGKNPFVGGLKDLKEGDCKVKTQFVYNKFQKRTELNSAEISFLDESIYLERVKLKRGVKYQATISYRNERKSLSGEFLKHVLRVAPFKFYGISPSMIGRARRIPWEAQKVAFVIQQLVEEFINNINYIGPLRENPKTLYVSGGELRKDVGLKGEYATDVLWAQSQGSRKDKLLLKRVNHWIQQFGLGSSIKLKPLGRQRQTGFFQLIIRNLKTAIDATINDVGFGVSQVLPLIVEGFYSRPDSSLFIEQPEIHLHPKVQADLGDLFIELAGQGRRIIVETHSEHLLSRLARRVVEGKTFTKDDLAIYYFSPEAENTLPKRIYINELGQFENWPEGFFQEDYLEALVHSRLIAEKLKQKERA
ncbi:MAG: DUF3696 domain-containing protein [Candidatus Omnitrophota bacterium]